MMMALIPLQLESLVTQALLEDLAQGDPTSEALVLLMPNPETVVTLAVRSRQLCVVSGLEVAEALCQKVDSALVFTPHVQNGTVVDAKQTVATISGTLPSILRVERTLLNFLQHLCGIATTTWGFVQRVEHTGCRITHTRKTTPLLRLVEQQAVLDGGGHVHRYNLGAAAMLKDNILQASGCSMAELAKAVRRRLPHTAKLEIEADTVDQVSEAIEAGADVILLDNMTIDEIQQAIALIAGRAIVEVSGGITLANVRAYAQLGVDVISTSQITLGATPIDIGLDVV